MLTTSHRLKIHNTYSSNHEQVLCISFKIIIHSQPRCQTPSKWIHQTLLLPVLPYTSLILPIHDKSSNWYVFPWHRQFLYLFYFVQTKTRNIVLWYPEYMIFMSYTAIRINKCNLPSVDSLFFFNYNDIVNIGNMTNHWSPNWFQFY